MVLPAQIDALKHFYLYFVCLSVECYSLLSFLCILFEATGKCSDPYARVQRPGRPWSPPLVSALNSDFHGVWRSVSPTFPATPAASSHEKPGSLHYGLCLYGLFI